MSKKRKPRIIIGKPAIQVIPRCVVQISDTTGPGKRRHFVNMTVYGSVDKVSEAIQAALRAGVDGGAL